MFHDAAVYLPMWLAPDLQAYRTDTFEGWVQQPAEIGPVFFSQSSPSYVLLQPVGAGEPTDTTAPGDTTDTTQPGEGDSDGGVPTWIWIVGGAVVLIGGGAAIAASRRKSADERE